MSIKICVVGYGSAFGMGHHHSDKIRATEGMELVGVCDPDAERREIAAATEEVPVYASLDEVVADDAVDMVALIVPHNLHAPLAIQAMNGGKHVITEKPLCVHVTEADEMLAAAKANDVCLTTYHNRRWDQDFVTVKYLIDQGMLGEVFMVECHVGGARPLKGWRRDEKSGGGMLRDWGAHVIDQCVQIAGGPAVKVFADLDHRMWTDIMDVPTHNQLLVQFESGMWADISLSNNSWTPRPRWRVLGEEGGLLKDTGGGGTVKYYHNVAGQPSVTDVPCLETDPSELYTNVAAHINDGVELIVDPANVRHTIAIFDAAYESAATGEAVVPA